MKNAGLGAAVAALGWATDKVPPAVKTGASGSEFRLQAVWVWTG